MTGLETILNQINDDARREADEQIETARAEAEKILDDARMIAEKAAAEIIANGEEKAKSIRDRAESSSQLVHRNAMLTFKQGVIRDVIENTRNALENAPEQEYFDVVLQLVSQFAAEGLAEMQMNRRDLDRLPKNFADKLKNAAPKTAITISNTPREIDSGFVLVYGGIDINCTFKAIFEDAEGKLRDTVGKILFPES